MQRYQFPINNYQLLPTIIDFEKYISQIPNPIILNTFVGPNFNERVNKAITTTKSDKAIIYSCECGFTQGNYYKGAICPHCRTQVSKTDPLRVNVVLEIPFGINVIHPTIYFMLTENKALAKIVESIFNVSKPIPDRVKDLIPKQGFTYTSQEFIEVMINVINRITNNRPTIKYVKLINVLQYYSNILFTNKIFISSTIHTEETYQKNLKTVDKSIKELLIAIYDILSLQLKTRVSPNRIHQVIFSAYKEYINYLKNLVKTKLQKKRALLKGSVFGTSLFFTTRLVANPITEPHEGDEIYLPWESAIEMFKLHIISKLNKKHNFKIVDAVKHLNRHMLKYCPIIDNIFKELIQESPYKGIPVLGCRPPSIKMGSMVLLFVTKVIYGIKVVKLSDLIIPELNLDFDICNLN